MMETKMVGLTLQNSFGIIGISACWPLVHQTSLDWEGESVGRKGLALQNDAILTKKTISRTKDKAIVF